MSHIFALQQLLEIAEAESESAAASLGIMNRQLHEHQQKLDMLLHYRDEYRERLRHASARGLDSGGLRNFHQFIERLEQAIAQQEHAITIARANVEGGRREWQVSRRKFKAFDTLAGRSKVQAQHLESQKQQKMQDDFATRAHGADRRTRR